jgi:hypothetical protein
LDNPLDAWILRGFRLAFFIFVRRLFDVKAYLMTTPKHTYLAFGEDCMKAAEKVVRVSGCRMEDISVGSQYQMTEDPEPIDVSKWWPIFTPYPGRHA